MHHSEGHMPPPPTRHFLYLRETTSWWCEGGGEGGGEGEEKVHLLTHATARGRGMGKNGLKKIQIPRANLRGGGIWPSWSKTNFLTF